MVDVAPGVSDAVETPEPPLFPPFPVPEALRREAAVAAWPDGLIQRLLDVRVSAADAAGWVRERSVEDVERYVEWQEQSMYGTVRARKATVSDNDAFADLWAHSGIDIGEWTVTVERSPNAFAQWRLQEHVVINVLEDRGLLVACQANSRRDTIVGGQRLTVAFPQAVRVRDGLRRHGYSQQVRGGGGGPHPNAPLETAILFQVRANNVTSLAWMEATWGGFAEAAAAGAGDDEPGLPVWVHLYPAAPSTATADHEASGVRPVRRGDLRRCVSLINRTHRGLDLFRPYTAEFLTRRLEDGSWGPKEMWLPPVYGWEDFVVLEEDGVVVACAGLWDRGRDLREVWRHRAGAAPDRVVESTALLDFGFAAGREDAMERLVRALLVRTAELGRDHLMAPLQFQPSLEARLADLEPVLDRRSIMWSPMSWGDEPPPPAPPLRRPYTCLGYW
jgi:hypothetical protein